MFKHSCYIENSEEAREWLKMIGIRLIGGTYGNTLMVVEGKAMCFELEGKIGTNFQDATNCFGNLPLFKALTAVRDDSDYMQEFTDGIDWVFCEAETVKIIALCHFMNNNERVLRKATKEELIEKFKI